jgi:protein PsiE
MDNKWVHQVLDIIEHAVLFTILVATMFAIGQELWLMIDAQKVKLSDLLLMFIYLEVIAMIRIYYKEHSLPIRYPLYIAIIALARYIILDSKDLEWEGLVGIGVTIVLLVIATLIHRFGIFTYPYKTHQRKQ